jgi:RNA polymerase sigma factor (TIGR02999 family)
MSDVTRLREGSRHGDAGAREDWLPLVYAELRQLASAKMCREQPGQTLQPTALVHEAWMRLGAQSFENRAHFFAAAAQGMRRILVDRARRRLAAKRGAGEQCIDVDELEIPAPVPDDQLLAVNDAVARFAAVDARKAELVKLRYFVGMSFEQAAEVLGIAVPTAKQWWAYSRACLRVELAGQSTGQSPAS